MAIKGCLCATNDAIRLAFVLPHGNNVFCNSSKARFLVDSQYNSIHICDKFVQVDCHLVTENTTSSLACEDLKDFDRTTVVSQQFMWPITPWMPQLIETVVGESILSAFSIMATSSEDALLYPVCHCLRAILNLADDSQPRRVLISQCWLKGLMKFSLSLYGVIWFRGVGSILAPVLPPDIKERADVQIAFFWQFHPFRGVVLFKMSKDVR